MPGKHTQPRPDSHANTGIDTDTYGDGAADTDTDACGYRSTSKKGSPRKEARRGITHACKLLSRSEEHFRNL